LIDVLTTRPNMATVTNQKMNNE